MKALYSEEHYRKHWDEYIKWTPGEDYIDLFGSLEKTMQRYRESGMPEEAMPIIEKIEAKALVDECMKIVRRQLTTLKDIEAGKASLGYTTANQETHARCRLRTRFDFNCLQLSDFRKKYGF